nr:zinc finger, CCHC-type [Tanacetum cinerariifolium]
ASKLLGLSGEGSGSRGEVVELGWNGGKWEKLYLRENRLKCYSASYLNVGGTSTVTGKWEKLCWRENRLKCYSASYLNVEGTGTVTDATVEAIRIMAKWENDDYICRGHILNVVKRTTQMLVVRERGLRTNPKTKVDAIAWWIDSGATTHVCKDRCWFKTCELVEDGSVLYIGDVW